MDAMERALDERTEDFTQLLAEEGFTRSEAERFVGEAGPALLRSYEWQERLLGTTPLARPYAAREILSTISGRRLATRVGLPEQKAWAGLRRLVPAVLRASRSAQAEEARASAPEMVTFDIGFGLTVEDSGAIAQQAAGESKAGRRKLGIRHPIFERFLASRD